MQLIPEHMRVIEANQLQPDHVVINIGKVEKVDRVQNFIRIFVKPLVINNEGIYYLYPTEILLIQD